MITDIWNAVASSLALLASYLSQRSLERSSEMESRLYEQMRDLSEKVDRLSEQISRMEKQAKKKRGLPPVS